VFKLEGSDHTVRNNVIDIQNAVSSGSWELVNALGEPLAKVSGSSTSGNVHVFNNTIFADHSFSSNVTFAQEDTGRGTGCPTGCFSRNNLAVWPNYTGDTTPNDDPSYTSSNNYLTTTEPFTATVPEQTLTQIDDFLLASPNASIIDAGYDFSSGTDTDRWVFDDLLLACRTDGQWDIGAHEYGASACVAGAAPAGSSASGSYSISWVAP
jgi:hypothetical protein